MEEILSMFSLEQWIVGAVAMSLTAALLPGLRVTSVFGPILAVVSLAFVNVHLWDAALFFSVPDTVTAQAALLIVVNGGIFWLLVKLLPGIEVSGILPALAAPVVFTFLSVAINTYGEDVDWSAVGAWSYEQIAGLKEYFLEAEPTQEASLL